MKGKKYKWYKVAESGKDIVFADNDLAAFEVNGQKIVLAKFRGELLACMYLCPHAGGELSRGYIDTKGNIVCPVHQYKFSLMSGKNTSGEGYYLKTYPVEIRHDGVFVGVESKRLFNF